MGLPTACILLAAHDKLKIELIRRSFEIDSSKTDLTIATTYGQALKHIAKCRPDLIITDLNLPDGRGTKLLRAGTNELPCPIIVMVRPEEEREGKEAIEEGAMDYVTESDANLRNLPYVSRRTLRDWSFKIDRNRVQKELEKTRLQLSEQLLAVQDKSVALKEVLGQIDKDKGESRSILRSDIEKTVSPLLAIIHEKAEGEVKQHVTLLQSLVKGLVSSLHSPTPRHSNLSPRESQICNMLKNGLSSKEIATVLNICLNTVHNHRIQIRRKLGIKGAKVNLTSHLQDT